MLNIKKNLLFVVVLLLIGQVAWAQNMETRQNFSLNTGFSLTGALLRGSQAFGNLITSDSLSIGNPTTVTVVPALQLNYDYALSKRISLGVGASYQNFGLESKNNRMIFLDNDLNPTNEDFAAQIHRFNVGLRVLFHYLPEGKADLYSGARLGWTHWRTPVTLEGDPAAWETFTNNFFAAQFIPLGFRYTISQGFGFNIETGIGAPHFLSLGLNYRM